jgi:hypothetical protein
VAILSQPRKNCVMLVRTIRIQILNFLNKLIMKHSAPRSLSADGQTWKTTLVGNSTQVREVMEKYAQQWYALTFINHEDTSRIKTAEEFMQKYFWEEGEDLSSEFMIRIDHRRKTVRIRKKEGIKGTILTLLQQGTTREKIREALRTSWSEQRQHNILTVSDDWSIPEESAATSFMRDDRYGSTWTPWAQFPIERIVDGVRRNMQKINSALLRPKPWKKLWKKGSK